MGQDAAVDNTLENLDIEETEDFQLRRDLAEIERNHQIGLANIRAMEQAQQRKHRRQLSRELSSFKRRIDLLTTKERVEKPNRGAAQEK